MSELTLLDQINELDKKITSFERDQVRLETEFKNAKDREKEIKAELEEEGLPTDITELRAMYVELKEKIEDEIKEIEAKIQRVEQGEEEVEECLDDIDLPF